MDTRWTVAGNGIEWNIAADAKLPHQDHIEMSGLQVSLILTYGVNEDGTLLVKRHLIWPMLRNKPNITGASFQVVINGNELPVIEVDGKRPVEAPVHARFDGVMALTSTTDAGVEICRELFPCVDEPAMMERITVKNVSGKPLRLSSRNGDHPNGGRGCKGVYLVESRVDRQGEIALAADASVVLGATYSGRIVSQPEVLPDVDCELLKRKARVAEITAPLQLETGVPEIDRAFHFAKLRAGESIFNTRNGLIHSPGGSAYYAASWCNDQVEYAGPWFAFTDDAVAIEASMNAYRQYMPFMGPDYLPIPSSVIAEGTDFWEGAGDRGDAAMYAYGASRFALTIGDRDMALELWPAIEWTLEYCRRKLTKDGVVASDSDELEGRIPAGDANLSTSSLYYGGLRSAVHLARMFGMPDKEKLYAEQADALEKSIESHFGHTFGEFKTYRYYDGNDVLRSWICLPLCMGIFDRAKETVDAMFSPRLWTDDGLLSQEGDKTFWDRSTLYGFRGGLQAGFTDEVFPKLTYYAGRRLLCDHVPYPVEAWPEGGQRHLSAESALYCRVITEGLFGMEPVGFNALRVFPRIPDGVDRIALRDIRAFGRRFDLIADRETVTVECGGEVVFTGKTGEALTVSF